MHGRLSRRRHLHPRGPAVQETRSGFKWQLFVDSEKQRFNMDKVLSAFDIFEVLLAIDLHLESKNGRRIQYKIALEDARRNDGTQMVIGEILTPKGRIMIADGDIYCWCIRCVFALSNRLLK